jgi:hypothetical protein
MSGAGENRWRRPGPGQGNNRQTQGAATPTPTKDGRQPSAATPPPNAWATKGKPAGPGQPATATAASAPAEHHVPVRGFNANEVKDFLKKNYLDSVADHQSVYHKVQGDSVAKRSSGAWGSRGNMSHLMPSGQDFFAQLKKQLATIEQTKSAQ